MRIDPARFLRRAFAVLLLTASCSDGASCPNDLPPSCPADAPGYKATIAPIIAARCGTCHTPAGAAPDKPFDTWAEVSQQRVGVLHQIYSCNMPPTEATQLTDAERAEILAWLVCGAPDD
ncbi:MAG: c-type cytochrome [Minicystis sp.]